jgi:hypothetical protein
MQRFAQTAVQATRLALWDGFVRPRQRESCCDGQLATEREQQLAGQVEQPRPLLGQQIP